MDPYSTHLPTLHFLFDNLLIKSVLELGVGNFSTPFFRGKEVKLTSLESDSNWARNFNTDEHKVVVVDSMPDYIVNLDEKYDLAFVDSNPACDRGICVQLLLPRIRIVVAHDTSPEDNWNYHYDKVVLPPGFVRIDDTAKYPWTSVYTDDQEVMKKMREFLENE